MAANIIQAQYETLAQIATRFHLQAEHITQMRERITCVSEDLLTQGWKGRGAGAFANEMGSVLPAMDRLQHALQEAGQVVLETVHIMREAEIAAAEPFRSDAFQATNLQLADPSYVAHTHSSLKDVADRLRLRQEIDYLLTTKAGQQLIDEAIDRQLTFEFPDGTIIGYQRNDTIIDRMIDATIIGYQENDTMIDVANEKTPQRIVKVEFGETDEIAVYNDETGAIIINYSKFRSYPEEGRAGILAHEMQHALDYQTGKASHEILEDIEQNSEKYPEQDSRKYSEQEISEKLAEYIKIQINTEIRAFERQQLVDESISDMPYTLDDDQDLTDEKRHHFLNKRPGYENFYETGLREALQDVLPDNHVIDVGFDNNNKIHINIRQITALDIFRDLFDRPYVTL